MSEQSQGGKITEQDILKVFDADDAPFLTASEIAGQLPVSRQAVNYRLDQMHEKKLVERKQVGARAVGWWSTVAPKLDASSRDRVARARAEIERGETVSLEEL